MLPTRKVLPNGDIEYTIQNRLHRIDGPAKIYNNGSKEYCINGTLHREDGPALIEDNGMINYFNYGHLHRYGGPARIWSNNEGEYYDSGEPSGMPKAGYVLTPEEYTQRQRVEAFNRILEGKEADKNDLFF